MSLSHRARQVVDWIVGLSLICIGIVGGFIPLLPGWVAVLAGLAVLSSHSSWARSILERLKRVGHWLRTRWRGRPDACGD
ncbi:MAG TPA: PGPGW domain-containing protein [Candidatus Polarisedimenticolaceae bacterium]|nr:PGPGW domain-containing protein [Candidatus Polarisedimenticolaceae bacterium]